MGQRICLFLRVLIHIIKLLSRKILCTYKYSTFYSTSASGAAHFLTPLSVLSNITAVFGQPEIGAKGYFKTCVSLVSNGFDPPPRLVSWFLNLDFIFIKAILGLKIQQSVKLILKNSRLPYSCSCLPTPQK